MLGQDGNTVAHIQVCSRTLARSSKMLDTLLYGPYSESLQKHSSTAAPWVVEIGEVDPGMLETVLRILHTHSPQPLTSPSENQLYDMVSVIDYLQCKRSFRFLSQSWQSMIMFTTSFSSRACCGKLLYVAIYLGLEDQVVKMLDGLQRKVNNVKNPGNGCIIQERMFFQDHHDPALPLMLEDEEELRFDTVLDKFDLASSLKKRRDALWRLEVEAKSKALEIYKSGLEPFDPRVKTGANGYSPAETCKSAQARQATRTICRDAISGSLWRQLCEHDMLSETYFEPESHRGNSLKSCLRALGKISLGGLGSTSPVLQGECGPVSGMRQEIHKLKHEFGTQLAAHSKFEFPEGMAKFLQDRKKLFEF